MKEEMNWKPLESVSALNYRTRENDNPKDKSRVYITCHPLDKDKHFESICKKILSLYDCAVFYTENMDAGYEKELLHTDLERMNVFVIPITYQLLSTSNRVISVDFPYAVENHIPVLPLMMEESLDYLFTEQFGELQYLNPNARDQTAIPFDEKLRKYLDGVLVSDEMRKRIQAAFDAYVFLSYRKKDRKYANELMQLIHKNPLCRDIAIWYDEFLVPGENFNDAIREAMEKSTLFTLLVTPNLLEDPNYVLTTEYPYAKEHYGDRILPVVMQETDSDELKLKYDGIPDCVSGRDDDAFRSKFQEGIRQVALCKNKENPSHNFLIGLAYLEGIDVEINREYALELITEAADAELPEAIEKLADMYHDGLGVERNWNKWMELLKKDYDLTLKSANPDDAALLAKKKSLAVCFNDMGRYQESAVLWQEVYATEKELHGEEDIEVMKTLGQLSIVYQNMGDIEKAKELNLSLANLQEKILGEKSIDYCLTMDRLGLNYYCLKEYEVARGYFVKALDGLRQTLGDRHPYTFTVWEHRLENSIKIEEFSYEYECDSLAYISGEKKIIYGENHPEALRSRAKAALYSAAEYGVGEVSRAKQIIFQLAKILGRDHPDVLTFYYRMVRFESSNAARDELIHIYYARKRVLGANHPDTLEALETLKSLLKKNEKYKENESSKKETETKMANIEKSLCKIKETIRTKLEETKEEAGAFVFHVLDEKGEYVRDAVFQVFRIRDIKKNLDNSYDFTSAIPYLTIPSYTFFNTHYHYAAFETIVLWYTIPSGTYVFHENKTQEGRFPCEDFELKIESGEIATPGKGYVINRIITSADLP